MDDQHLQRSRIKLDFVYFPLNIYYFSNSFGANFAS